jgi:Zn-finger nucleic acid-binding protein
MLFIEDLADIKKIQEFWAAQHAVYTKESNESDYCPKERNIKITRNGLKNVYKKKKKNSSNLGENNYNFVQNFDKYSNYINDDYFSKKNLEIARDKRSSNFYPNKSRPF